VVGSSIALIDKNMPTVVIAPTDSLFDKVLSNMQEVKARGGRIIAITDADDAQIGSMADYVIKIPKAHPILTPLLTVVPLQLLAYHIAVMRGCDVDTPRNLAKSVTVE
jgi:glucosamine--fructose-6-phosphate aminotransferase (isomerizing)